MPTSSLTDVAWQIKVHCRLAALVEWDLIENERMGVNAIDG